MPIEIEPFEPILQYKNAMHSINPLDFSYIFDGNKCQFMHWNVIFFPIADSLHWNRLPFRINGWAYKISTNGIASAVYNQYLLFHRNQNTDWTVCRLTHELSSVEHLLITIQYDNVITSILTLMWGQFIFSNQNYAMCLFRSQCTVDVFIAFLNKFTWIKPVHFV